MPLTHLDEKGAARMVDVGQKIPTVRRAIASGLVKMNPDTIEQIKDGDLPKGDVLAVARVAGIMAAKRTPELIPLCHPLPISSVKLDFNLLTDAVEITAEVSTNAPTGVEMEALTAVSVAALAIYDMIKAVQKDAVISDVRLLHKSGGKSGTFDRK